VLLSAVGRMNAYGTNEERAREQARGQRALFSLTAAARTYETIPMSQQQQRLGQSSCVRTGERIETAAAALDRDSPLSLTLGQLADMFDIAIYDRESV